ncbi:MAG TPA: hypothetical protein VKW06_00380 [Candidatus Angelobacter sp.]|nr:hypothetical protein [Candidatus Angelobacter sp.]
MAKHHMRNEVSFSKWCNKCQAFTQHRVDGVKDGPCLQCIERAEKERQERKKIPPPAKQEGFKF